MLTRREGLDDAGGAAGGRDIWWRWSLRQVSRARCARDLPSRVRLAAPALGPVLGIKANRDHAGVGLVRTGLHGHRRSAPGVRANRSTG